MVTSPLVGSSWPDRIFQKRGFSRAVGADQAVAVAFRKLDIHIFKKGLFADAECNVVCTDHETVLSYFLIKRLCAFGIKVYFTQKSVFCKRSGRICAEFPRGLARTAFRQAERGTQNGRGEILYF